MASLAASRLRWMPGRIEPLAPVGGLGWDSVLPFQVPDRIRVVSICHGYLCEAEVSPRPERVLLLLLELILKSLSELDISQGQIRVAWPINEHICAVTCRKQLVFKELCRGNSSLFFFLLALFFPLTFGLS